jgi:hypothetical protein
MVFLNGQSLNMTSQNDRRTLGHFYEQQLYNLLVSNGYDFHLAKNKFCCYDFYHYDEKNSIKIFLELKTRTKPLNEFVVEYADVEKIRKYRQINDITFPSDECIFYYIYNHIIDEEHTEYYYYKIDFNTIDDFFVSDVCGKKTYEIPIRCVKPLKELFNRLD